MKSPNYIAKLITEDPDIANDSVAWEHEKQLKAEELEDIELLGEVMYDILFTVGATQHGGEPPTRDMRGSGYIDQGTRGEWEWAVLSVDEILKATDENGEDVSVKLNKELEEELTKALYKHLDDETIQDHFEDEEPRI